MPSRIRTKLERLLITPVLLLCAPIGVRAGFIKDWQLKEIAAAPVLVVGRVLEVHKNERVPDGSLPWNAETWSMTAEIQVLRLHSSSEEPASLDRIRVSFLSYGPSVTAFINGYPPPLPQFAPGRVMILPLRENKAPASEPWHLTADSGIGLTIPAEEMERSLPQPNTARAFLVREIANSLSRGTPREISAAAGYVAGQQESLRVELMPQLEPVIGDDRRRWAELAANLLAMQGIPRPSVAELLTNKDEPMGWPGRRESLFLAQSALLKLKASPETDALLIRTWVREVPLHSWGSANALLQYADNPVTIESLRQALRDDVVGSSYVAWTFAHAGHATALPEALERALKVADRPKSDPTDLQGAAATLRDYGNDRQLEELAELVRKYQTGDRNFYSMLWQYATEAGNPREARVLAVVLSDRRIVSGETRYCDFAAGVLERAVGQHFGAGAKTLQERNDAVSRAVAWLKSQGLSN